MKVTEKYISRYLGCGYYCYFCLRDSEFYYTMKLRLVHITDRMVGLCCENCFNKTLESTWLTWDKIEAERDYVLKGIYRWYQDGKRWSRAK